MKAALDAVLVAAFCYDERDFGQAVALSEVLELIHSVAGVRQVELTGFHPITASVPRGGDGLDAAPVAELVVFDVSSLSNLTVILA